MRPSRKRSWATCSALHLTHTTHTHTKNTTHTVLRKIATKQEEELGDTSTLADPSVVQQLVELRGK